jgi:predicted metal-dependent hydrolase
MPQLKYLAHYAPTITDQVQKLIDSRKLGELLLKKYPPNTLHNVKTDKALYNFVMDIKNQYLRQSSPVSKITYDDKLDVLHQALGMHTFISRVQGNKLKAKHEILIGGVFRNAPLSFLRMIVVHELAHLKEKDHNKAFYKLCQHMEAEYHQLEFDVRLYLTYTDLEGDLYQTKAS